MWTVMVLMLMIAIDLMASHFLFYYDRLGNADTFGSGDQGGRFPSTVLVSRMLARLGESGQTPGKKPGCKLTSRPSPFYQEHLELTWMVLPGKYDVFFCPNDKTSPLPFKWTLTMEDDISPNRRATSIDEIVRDKRIYIFGYGLNDEYTFAWHLQDALRDEWEVQHFAMAGFGNTHNLIQFHKLKERVTDRDILIFGYGDYYNVRNVAAPSRFSKIVSYTKSKALAHPQAVLSDGDLKIEFLPLDCSKVSGYCDEPDPPLSEMAEVTSAIFDEIVQSTVATVAVLFIRGEDDDPVISRLRDRGIAVIDVRSGNYEHFVRDNILNYDSHGGPVTHYTWYREVLGFMNSLFRTMPNRPALNPDFPRLAVSILGIV